MSININKAQADFLSKGGDLGGTDIAEFGVVAGVLQQYGAELLDNIEYFGNQRGVVGSGDLLSNMIHRYFCLYNFPWLIFHEINP